MRRGGCLCRSDSRSKVLVRMECREILNLSVSRKVRQMGIRFVFRLDPISAFFSVFLISVSLILVVERGCCHLAVHMTDAMHVCARRTLLRFFILLPSLSPKSVRHPEA